MCGSHLQNLVFRHEVRNVEDLEKPEITNNTLLADRAYRYITQDTLYLKHIRMDTSIFGTLNFISHNKKAKFKGE